MMVKEVNVMEDVKQKELLFKNKLKWKVYHDEFKDIKTYTYNCFRYHVIITDQKILKDFIDLVCDEGRVTQSSICNFFIERDIKYKLRFRYLTKAPLKDNYKMFSQVLWLNFQKIKVIFNRTYNYEFKFDKKEIAGKIRNHLLIRLIDIKNYKIYFLEADTNIWWLPKVKKTSSDSKNTFYVGWLFAMAGYVVYNKKPVKS